MKNLFIFLFFSINLAFAFNVECDKKQYCSQMDSCEEAKAYLQQCPNRSYLDRDKDGIPCEKNLQILNHFQ